MSEKLVILHFKPYAGYPPVQNLFNYLSGKQGMNVICLTTKNSSLYQNEGNFQKVRYLADLDVGSFKLSRLFNYLTFYIKAIFLLFKLKPKWIIYYDTMSCLPAWIFYLLNRQVNIYIHHHEYVSLKEYHSGMLLTKLLFYLENSFLNKAKWISQTNNDRLNLFLNDRKTISFNDVSLNIMPNYPPRDWIEKVPLRRDNSIIKLVYVGYSLSFDAMFINEVFDWVLSMDGKVKLDCYLHKPSDSAAEYLEDNNITGVNLLKSIKYYDLPNILSYYDIGLILYKGTTDNYKYNAPNKLFEYLACGLDVWVPNVMEGSLPYVCEEKRPRVLDIDFKNLNLYKSDFLFGGQNLPVRTVEYSCGIVYNKLYNVLLKSEPNI